MYKLAIFDLDGTLLDTLDDLSTACNHALEACGFPVYSSQEYKAFIGSGAAMLIERALPDGQRTQTNIQQVLALFRTYYSDHDREKTQPFDGIPELLAELKRRKINLAILSNKPHANTQALAEYYFPGIFDIVFGQREEVPRKPDPAAVFEIMERLGVKKEECVYIGDSDIDVCTGNNAGVEAIGVTWGFCTVDQLKDAGKSIIINKTKELENFFVDN